MGATLAVLAGLGLLAFLFGSTGGPKKGVAVSPDVQLYYVVREGDSPAVVAARIVGTDRRYVELVEANPEVPTVGDPLNPWSTGYNFARFNVGDKLKLPRAWNAFVDQLGNFAGSTTPFPS